MLEQRLIQRPAQHAEPMIGRMSKAHRLGLVLLLNLLLVAALVVVGVTAHSLGVLAAGVDYLADAAAIGISVTAIWLAHQSASRHRRWPDATHIAALVNAGWLLALNIWVVVAAIRRLMSGATEVHGLPVLIVSATAAVVMFIGAIIVGGDVDNDVGAEDLNVKAVLLDTAADAAAAGGVAVTAAPARPTACVKCPRQRSRCSLGKQMTDDNPLTAGVVIRAVGHAVPCNESAVTAAAPGQAVRPERFI